MSREEQTVFFLKKNGWEGNLAGRQNRMEWNKQTDKTGLSYGPGPGAQLAPGVRGSISGRLPQGQSAHKLNEVTT